MIWDNFINVLRKYAVFSGRASRAEYWYFVLVYVLMYFVIFGIDRVLFRDTAIFSFIFSLAMLIPSLAVAVRRLHDVGKSWTWLFIALIPIIGSIWLLVLYVTKGQIGPNKYGAEPGPLSNKPAGEISPVAKPEAPREAPPASFENERTEGELN